MLFTITTQQFNLGCHMHHFPTCINLPLKTGCNKQVKTGENSQKEPTGLGLVVRHSVILTLLLTSSRCGLTLLSTAHRLKQALWIICSTTLCFVKKGKWQQIGEGINFSPDESAAGVQPLVVSNCFVWLDAFCSNQTVSLYLALVFGYNLQ